MACGLSIDIMTFDLAWPWKVKSRSRNFWSQISRQWCKIRGWSQWRSDRKSHMGYRLVSSLLAYRDLERSSQGHVVFKTKYLANGTRHGVGVNGRRLSIDWRHSHWITVILNGQKSICSRRLNISRRFLHIYTYIFQVCSVQDVWFMVSAAAVQIRTRIQNRLSSIQLLSQTGYFIDGELTWSALWRKLPATIFTL